MSCIKNKFYNKLRKISRKLLDYQKLYFKHSRTHITYDNVLVFLDLSAQLYRWVKEKNHVLKERNKMLVNRDRILEMIFSTENEIEEAKLEEVYLNIKKFNKIVRSLGIFKSKFKNNWKLSEEKLKFLSQCDSSIEEKDDSTMVFKKPSKSEPKANLKVE